MRDPYEVLGVSKTATAGEIKSAFRKLAKKHHPDQSKDPRAKDKFAEINGAYEVVGDEKKRVAYDRGEIDAEGKPRAPQFEGFAAGRGAGGPDLHGFNFDFGGGGMPGGRPGSFDPDVFADLFGARQNAGGRGGGRGSLRGEDLPADLTIPLTTALTGGSMRVTLPTGKSLEVMIPIGIEDGKAIRLRGQGSPGVGRGAPGDAIITVHYAPHPLFKVEGRDLRFELPIALYEAVLGATVRVPTLDGAVEASIPAGTSSGRVLRFRGKGLPAAGDAAQGDLLATVRIVLPPEDDAKLDALMREWRDKKPYDPRAGTV